MTTGTFILASKSILALTALERWQAMHNWAGAVDHGRWFLAVIVLAGILAASIVVLVVIHLLGKLRRDDQKFADLAEVNGLNDQERNVLAYVARHAGLKRPSAIFTMDDAFEQGAEALVKSNDFTRLAPQARQQTLATITRMREKLGGYKSDDSEAAAGSRQIARGTSISIVHSGKSDNSVATIAENNSAEMVIQPDIPGSYQPGQTLLIRFSDGRGGNWEFDAPVLRQEGEKVVLGHVGKVRFINLRRFPRVAVKQPARIAPFAFIREDQRLDLALQPAELVELAGPGLKFISAATFAVEDRALAVVQLPDGQVVEAVGKVRRFNRESPGRNSVVVELMGLTPGELAVLARQTNMAEQQAQQAAEPAASAGPKEALAHA